jgi:hypothetical protein
MLIGRNGCSPGTAEAGAVHGYGKGYKGYHIEAEVLSCGAHRRSASKFGGATNDGTANDAEFVMLRR